MAKRACHAGRQNDQTRNDARPGRQRQLLAIIAATDIGHLIEQEARRISCQAASRVDEVGIGNPIRPADTDIDQPAAPDIERPVIGRRDRLDLVDEAQATQDIDLLSGDLFDAEFIRRNLALVDQEDPIPGASEDSSGERACQAGADDGDVRLDDLHRADRARHGRTFLGNHDVRSDG